MEAIKEVRQENGRKYSQFVTDTTEKIKTNIVLNPYLWASTGGGMLVVRSFFFGGGLGILAYCIGNRIYK